MNPRALIVIVGCIMFMCGLLVGLHGSRAETLSGLPYITDADTVTISGTRIRLAGIDAPEMSQTCLDAKGTPYRCGETAREALTRFAAGKTWTCELQPRPDRYGRRVGVCEVGGILPRMRGEDEHSRRGGGVDINRWLVRQGWALDWPRFSHGRYAEDQVVARGACRGVWAGSFAPPWDYRHRTCSGPALGCRSGTVEAKELCR